MASRHSNGDMRSASFSDYLNHDLEESAGRDSADSLPQYELPLPVLPRKNGPRDREIDVFDAKKYFNTSSDDVVPPVTRDKKESHIDNPVMKSESPRAISGMRSGTGSPLRGDGSADVPHHKKNHGGSRRQAILSGFTCRGLCSDSKSVQVSEESQIKKPDSRQVPDKNPRRSDVSGSEKTEEFEFPILSNAEPVAVKEQSKKSQDVSGSEGKAIGGDAIAVHLQRKLAITTWDAIPRAQALPLPLRTDASRVDEAESCTSSDLFEIESVSAICRDGNSRPVRSGAPPEKESQKRPGSSRFSFSGFKSQKPASVVAEPRKETRLK